MNNPFYNNALLSKLCSILQDLTCEEDKIVIGNMMKKLMPKKSKYNFTLEELASITKTEAGHHASGVNKSEWFACDYVKAVYNFDVQFEDEYSYNEDNENLWDNWYQIIRKMNYDFRIVRACLYKNIPEDIKIVSVEGFDLYVTNIFIEQFLEFKKEYDLQCVVVLP